MKTKPLVKITKKEAVEITETVHEMILLLYDSKLVSELNLIEKHAASCIERLKFKPLKGE